MTWTYQLEPEMCRNWSASPLAGIGLVQEASGISPHPVKVSLPLGIGGSEAGRQVSREKAWLSH